MRGLLIAVILVIAGPSGRAQLPPQATAARLGGADCAVIQTALDAYLTRARDAGERWGFTDLLFYVLDTSDAQRPHQISAAALFADPQSRDLLERLLAQPIAESLLARANTPTWLLDCDLPIGFAFVNDLQGVQLNTPYDYLRYQVFPGFEGIVYVSLPGYSPDECEALISVYGEFPIWEEHLVYHFVNEGTAWRLEKSFQVYLRGE